MLLVFMPLLLGTLLMQVKRLLCMLLTYSLVHLKPLLRLTKLLTLSLLRFMLLLLVTLPMLTLLLLGMLRTILLQISDIYRRLNKNSKIMLKSTILLMFGLVLVLLLILLTRCGMVPWVIIGIMALAVVTELLLTDQK